MISSFRLKQRYLTGFDPAVLLQTLKWLPTYLKTLRQYRRMAPPPSFRFRFADAFPILTDLEVAVGEGVFGWIVIAPRLWLRRPDSYYPELLPPS